MSTSRSLIIEIHAAEGGHDAKSLVEEQFAIYAKRAIRGGL
jgi:protein subunit release factor A